MNNMRNTPTLYTSRLILRRFEAQDAPALLRILSDEQVNTFLPMFPLKDLEEAQAYLQQSYLKSYEAPIGFRYAICLKEDDIPIGYVGIGEGDSYDLGYGLAKEHWHKGIVSEACMALVQEIRGCGMEYITATHDVNNPRSGAVMRRIGMQYKYSYEEQWQPKDIPVIFRMYQLNLDGKEERTYKHYWDKYPIHFVEDGV